MIEKYKNLAECLEWNLDNDFGIPTPSKLLHKLQTDYDTQIKLYMECLSNASPEERKNFHIQIYETLYVMAEHDDAESIHLLFELCPDMRREGYYSFDQYLPLGEAIQNNAYRAIEALLANGCDVNLATFAPESTIAFAMDEDASENMIIYLLEKGALLEFNDLLQVCVYQNNRELAEKMIVTVQDFQSKDRVRWLLESALSYAEEKEAEEIG